MPDRDPDSLAVVWQVIAHPEGIFVEEILGQGTARTIGPLPDRQAAQALILALRTEIDGMFASWQADLKSLRALSSAREVQEATELRDSERDKSNDSSLGPLATP